MTDAADLKPDLGRFGVWTVRRAVRPSRPSRSRSWATARCGSAGPRPATWPSSSPSSRRPRRCRWPPASSTCGRRPPTEVAESYHRIEKAYPGPVPARHRHRPPRAHRGVPQALRRARRVPGRPGRRQRADQPPRRRRARARRCSSCRRKRSAGAHPYLTTPEHTAQAHATHRQHACTWRPSTRSC